jgi:hypothetical protein
MNTPIHARGISGTLVARHRILPSAADMARRLALTDAAGKSFSPL